MPAPALPLLPSVKPSSAASRKKCSVPASEDLQWAHEQGGSDFGPCRLRRSALPSQNCLLQHAAQGEGRSQGLLGSQHLTPRAWLCPLGQLELEPDTEIESWMEAGVEGVLD